MLIHHATHVGSFAAFHAYLTHVCELHERTHAFLKFASPKNWFKRADTTIVLKWLRSKFMAVRLQHPGNEYLSEICKCLQLSNEFFSLLELWLSKRARRTAWALGKDMLDTYKGCAAHAHRHGVPRFKLTPKLYFAMHIVMSLHGSPCLNILAHSCQQNEDLINEGAMICRKVSQQNLHMNVLLQYLVSVIRHW